MWLMNRVSFEGLSARAISVSDGKPIDTPRGSRGTSYRLYAGDIGFFDITDLGEVNSHSAGRAALDINGELLEYSQSGENVLLNLTVKAPDLIELGVPGENRVSVALSDFPELSASDVSLIQEMEKLGILPFRNDPNTQKTPAEIKARLQKLGRQYFPFSKHSYELALSIYDWTTADFFRMDLFLLYSYTGLAGTPLNISQIADGVVTSNWGTYKMTNANFMNSFMMRPVKEAQEVTPQLEAVKGKLRNFLRALARVTIAAKHSLPRISIAQTPLLYSGQVAIRNLGNETMAAYFLECPANQGPVGESIEMDIDQALQSFLAPGNVVTWKSFISFTADEKEAEQYSNGLLLVLGPPAGARVWGAGITSITPLSDQPETKNEYTFSPGSRIKINGHEKKEVNGKELTVIHMTFLDKVVPIPGIGP